MSDLLSEAMREAVASARSDAVDYHTFELNCASFSEPARVAWGWDEVSAKLEDGAPTDPGETVLFRPAPMDFSPPEVVSDSESALVFSLFNVSKDIIVSLDGYRDDPQPVTMIYRVFLSNRLHLGPEKDPPMVMQVKNFGVDPTGGKISGRAGFSSLIGRNFPYPSYTILRFPGLRRY